MGLTPIQTRHAEIDASLRRQACKMAEVIAPRYKETPRELIDRLCTKNEAPFKFDGANTLQLRYVCIELKARL